MAVNLFPPEPSEIYSVPGVVLGVAAANIRKPNRNDVLVVELALGSRVAGVFTSNRFAAAPVQVCRAHLAETNNISRQHRHSKRRHWRTRSPRCSGNLQKGRRYLRLLSDAGSSVLNRCHHGTASHEPLA